MLSRMLLPTSTFNFVDLNQKFRKWFIHIIIWKLITVVGTEVAAIRICVFKSGDIVFRAIYITFRDDQSNEVILVQCFILQEQITKSLR